MKVLLWLDDTRNPFLDKEQKLPEFTGVIEWVRNYDEFRDWILSNPLPDIVSFDHDLADEHYTPEFFWNDYELSKEFQEWKQKSYVHKTGFDCAKWLANYCEVEKSKLPDFHVHSANPVGRDNILKLLSKYKSTDNLHSYNH